MKSGVVHTVLLVDDDPWILAAVSRMLAAESCRVLTTTDPLQALPIIEWENVDVLVADIAMPEVDGVDLVQRARRLFPDVVRILLTGAASLGDALRAINEAEVFRFLTKPVQEAELREAVREAVGRREALWLTAARERTAARRQAALGELEKRHPGLASVALVGGVHVIPDERILELGSRLRGTALEGWLDAAPGSRGGDESTRAI